jgi:hypothetical protein
VEAQSNALEEAKALRELKRWRDGFCHDNIIRLISFKDERHPDDGLFLLRVW